VNITLALAMLWPGFRATNSAADATVCAPLMMDRPRMRSFLNPADGSDAVVQIEKVCRVVQQGCLDGAVHF
jgi:hypothetical protein